MASVLLDVYATEIPSLTVNHGLNPAYFGSHVLFGGRKFFGSPNGAEQGKSVLVSQDAFMTSFWAGSRDVLGQIRTWGNVCVAGGFVLGCMRGLGSAVPPPSDIDVFLYGLNDDESARAKVFEILQALYLGYKAVDVDQRLEVGVTVTDRAVTVIPMLIENGLIVKDSRLFRVQIVLKNFASIDDVVGRFDLDSWCVAYDGERVLAHPRAVRALVTSVNLVDLAYWSPAFEFRALKYVMRGFAIGFVSEMDIVVDGEYGLSRFKTHEGDYEEVTAGNVLQCVTAYQGLARLLYAHSAEALGVKWEGLLTGSYAIGSFEGAPPSEPVPSRRLAAILSGEERLGKPLDFNWPGFEERGIEEYEWVEDVLEAVGQSLSESSSGSM